MVGSGEVDLYVRRLLDRGIVVELCAVVGGDRLELTGGASDQHLETLARLQLGPISELSDERVTRLPFFRSTKVVTQSFAPFPTTVSTSQ